MNEKESEDEMANEQDKTAIRGALDYIGRVPMNQRESEALAVVRTEIERAWGECARLNTTLTNVWNTLATALNELDINPVLDPEACAQQAAGVIVGTLTGRPVLTAEQARAQVEAIVYVLGRSPFAMVGPLVKLLMRVAGPVTAEQASVARAFEVVDDPQTSAALSAFAAAGFGSMQLLHATPPPETAEHASMDLPADYAARRAQGETGHGLVLPDPDPECILCADREPGVYMDKECPECSSPEALRRRAAGPEMATTTGAAPDGEECGAAMVGPPCPGCRADCMGWVVDGAPCDGVSQ